MKEKVLAICQEMEQEADDLIDESEQCQAAALHRYARALRQAVEEKQTIGSEEWEVDL